MSKKESFKSFVSKNPSFARNVDSGKVTWQKLFETYDLYGENSEIWNDYRVKETTKETTEGAISIKGLLNSLKNVNLDSFQENISSLQKAVGFLEDITTKSEDKETKNKGTKEEKDISKFYSD